MSSLAEDMSDHRRPRGAGATVVIPVLLLGATTAFLLARRWWRMRDEDPDEDPIVEPPPRYLQDAVPVDGEAAIHPPPGTELIQRSIVQG